MKVKYIFLAALMAMNFGAKAQTSGTCGDGVEWEITGTAPNQTLTISYTGSGTGVMTDYTVGIPPWISQRANLTTLVIDNGVTTIGNFAFQYCDGFTSVTVGHETPLSINANAFRDVPIQNICLYVPYGSIRLYREANVWKDFDFICVITELVPEFRDLQNEIVALQNENSDLKDSISGLKNENFALQNDLKDCQDDKINLQNMLAACQASLDSCLNAQTGGIAPPQGLQSESQLMIYPNPANNELRITIGGEYHSPIQYSIYSVVGQVVMVGAYPCGRPEMTIDVSHLSAGMYYLKIDGKTARFVKE